MELGELREIIEIQECKKIQNDYGATETVYNTISKPRAKVKYISTKEYLQNNTHMTSQILKFIIRNRDVTNEHFVLYKNEKYDIKNVYLFEDRTFIEITGEKVK